MTRRLGPVRDALAHGRGVASLLLLALLLPSPAHARQAQQGTTFEITADGCPGPATRRRQTGFIAKPWPGIVTALHGVAGCGVVTARRVTESVVFPALDLEEVDVERDLALLSSRGLLAALEAGRLQAYDVADPPAAGTTLLLIGYPQSSPTPVDARVLVESLGYTLRDVVPPSSVPALEARNSPSLDTRVVRLQGPIQPGLSGAPLVSVPHGAVGVGQGGFGRGEFDIGWAIPLRGAVFVPRASEEERLAALAGSPARLQLSLDPEGVLPYWRGRQVALKSELPLDGASWRPGAEVRVLWRRTWRERRVDMGFGLGLFPWRTEVSYATLPGLPPQREVRREERIELPLVLRALLAQEPVGPFDPYLGLTASPVFGSYGSVDAGTLAWLARWLVLDLAVRGVVAYAPLDRITFDPFGNARATMARSWTGGVRLSLSLSWVT